MIAVESCCIELQTLIYAQRFSYFVSVKICTNNCRILSSCLNDQISSANLLCPCWEMHHLLNIGTYAIKNPNLYEWILIISKSLIYFPQCNVPKLNDWIHSTILHTGWHPVVFMSRDAPLTKYWYIHNQNSKYMWIDADNFKVLNTYFPRCNVPKLNDWIHSAILHTGWHPVVFMSWDAPLAEYWHVRNQSYKSMWTNTNYFKLLDIFPTMQCAKT